ncbi:hypothetical protein AXF42_Ash019762 [Apostasia shenzhenica]|uniref:Uncharacterized protein n=1 Tax=Apostasia shenzhenica TaxID=1088818 RepID=A0A2H9ZRT1_9ASPA|nr:hypothetical protein AXF42_Ash019762 [Apostasia shenzhenica]
MNSYDPRRMKRLAMDFVVPSLPHKVERCCQPMRDKVVAIMRDRSSHALKKLRVLFFRRNARCLPGNVVWGFRRLAGVRIPRELSRLRKLFGPHGCILPLLQPAGCSAGYLRVPPNKCVVLARLLHWNERLALG